MERAEDVLTHKRLLQLAEDPSNCPVVEVRLVQVLQCVLVVMSVGWAKNLNPYLRLLLRGIAMPLAVIIISHLLIANHHFCYLIFCMSLCGRCWYYHLAHLYEMTFKLD